MVENVLYSGWKPIHIVVLYFEDYCGFKKTRPATTAVIHQLRCSIWA